MSSMYITSLWVIDLIIPSERRNKNAYTLFSIIIFSAHNYHIILICARKKYAAINRRRCRFPLIQFLFSLRYAAASISAVYITSIYATHHGSLQLQIVVCMRVCLLYYSCFIVPPRRRTSPCTE